MMSDFDTKELPMRDAFLPIIRVLKALGGHFTFTDTDGEQYVVIKKSELEAQTKPKETQLTISSVTEEIVLDNEDDVVSRVNQDIALSHVEEEDEPDDLSASYLDSSEEVADDSYLRPTPPPVRIRFEPIKGDLPPELQE